jgi:hypothetical protein
MTNRLRKRLARHDAQAHTLLLALYREYPVGRVIQWRHGRHWRTAEIVAQGGEWGGIEHAQFKVRSAAGREYWISASLVIADR